MKFIPERHHWVEGHGYLCPGNHDQDDYECAECGGLDLADRHLMVSNAPRRDRVMLCRMCMATYMAMIELHDLVGA